MAYLYSDADVLLVGQYGDSMKPTSGAEAVLANQRCIWLWVSKSWSEGLGRNVGCEWYHPTTSRPSSWSRSLASVWETMKTVTINMIVCIFTCTRPIHPLTLNLLISYIYGATSRARTVNVVYILTYIWQCWQLSIFISCTMYQHWMNAERFPLFYLFILSQLPGKPELFMNA